MKTRFLLLVSVTAILATSSYGQQTGGGASGGTAGGAAVPPAANPPGTTLPPGLEKRDQLPPGLRRDQLPPGLANRQEQQNGASNAVGSATNGFFGTNQFGQITNRFDTNPLANRLTNQISTNAFAVSGSNAFRRPLGGTNMLTPTGGTNRLFGTNTSMLSTNTFSFTNTVAFTLQDVATTPTDRSLLVQIRQTISVQPIGIGPWAPIHFRAREGNVTIVGFVPSPDVGQQVASVVQTVPGVSQVINDLEVLAQDVAATVADQTLLNQIQTRVAPRIVSLGLTQPVHFIVRQGVVTIVASIRQPQVQQQLASMVMSVPGVVQVANNVSATNRMTAGVLPGATGTAALAATNSAAPLSASAPSAAAAPSASTTNQFGFVTDTNAAGSTNLAPTSNPNRPSRVFGTNSNLPPGLQNRSELPRGLQNRDELPPGLAERTNAPTPP